MRCRKCGATSEEYYEGKPVKFCSVCGTNFKNDCPWCGAELQSEFCAGGWRRCGACKFPLLYCMECDLGYPLGTRVCDCGAMLNERIPVHFARLVNSCRSNTYVSHQPGYVISLPDMTDNRVSAPLVFGSIVYYWAKSQSSSSSWSLRRFDTLASGIAPLAGDIKISCQMDDVPVIELYNRFIVTYSKHHLWVHDVYTGEMRYELSILSPFTAYIDDESRIVIHKYKATEGRETISVIQEFREEREVFSQPVTVQQDGTPVATPVMNEGVLYFASFVSGLIALNIKADFEGKYVHSQDLNHGKICQLTKVSNVLFFTFYDKTRHSFRWGRIIPATSAVMLYNGELIHPYMAVHNEGIVTCERQGNAPVLRNYGLHGIDIQPPNYEKRLVNIRELYSYFLASCGERLFCVIRYKAEPTSYCGGAYVEILSGDRNTISMVGTGFPEAYKENNHQACIGNTVVSFIDNGSGRALLKAHELGARQ